MEGKSSFVFETVIKEKIEKLITNTNIRKVAQSNDIPTKLVKEFVYFFPNISRQALTDAQKEVLL